MPHKLVLAFSFILVLASLSRASAPSQRPRGVAKSKAHLYLPSSDGTWQCLDGSNVIAFDQVNDDYCDCKDGSDEPGTPACPNGRFHCTNAGHKPAYIPSSHVNDGVCDPECCDGSDEYDGQISCPNTCKELGLAARKAAEENAKTALRGWKTRQTYVETAKRKKSELEAERDRLETQILAAEQKEQELKIVLERAEIRETKVSKFGEKIADRAREKINEYKLALTALRDEIGYHTGRIATLEGILEALKNDHNQNYHDMAVKTAITGWDELKGDTMPDFGITEEKLDILEKDSVDLGDEDVDFTDEFDETVSLLYRIQEYFPIQVKDFIKDKVAYLHSILVDQGFLQDNKPADGPKVSRALQKARDAHSQAVTETSRLRNEVDSINSRITADHGPEDVFRAIREDCFSLDSGEYTYSVCIMGQVTQKSNKDSRSTRLGSFSQFENEFKTIMYEHGERCWNGPERSAKVDLECGGENEVIKVTEPSKCEYLIKMRSPAVCTKPESKKGVRDEL